MPSTPNYSFTVRSLLKAADNARRTPFSSRTPGYENDHMIDLQLVAEALNRLPNETYSGHQLREIVDFVNGADDMEPMKEEDHDRKSAAVTKLRRQTFQNRAEVDRAKKYIRLVRQRWEKIRGDLPDGFEEFAEKMEEILYAKAILRETDELVVI